jgi:diguanylate cyclase (GGDEF)-like protein
MTARTWSIRIAAAAFVTLPLPLPLPSPTLPSVSPPTVNASPALPVVTPLVPTGGTPVTLPHATADAPQTSNAAGGPAHSSQPATQSGGAGSNGSPGGIPIPFTAIYVSSPLDIALLGALVTLPLLFGMWLLLFGRTFAEARRARDAQVRLMLAADLGLPPRDLSSTSTKALFNLREKAAFDELTGVMRRAAGVSMADREIARARRHKMPLAVAFIDLDGLKEANDAKGHAAGDALLLGLTRALKDGLREEDVVMRYGGDEFVCLLPDTSAPDARTKLAKIQDAARAEGIRFCAGVAELQRSDDVVSLLARADRDLYDFKAHRDEIVPLPQRPRSSEASTPAAAAGGKPLNTNSTSSDPYSRVLVRLASWRAPRAAASGPFSESPRSRRSPD